MNFNCHNIKKDFADKIIPLILSALTLILSCSTITAAWYSEPENSLSQKRDDGTEYASITVEGMKYEI